MTAPGRCLACEGELAAAPAVRAGDRMHGTSGTWAVHQCLRCGSGITLPAVGEEQLDAFYPPTYAPFDLPSAAVARAMAILQRARDRRFPLACLAAGRRVGSGTGTLLDVGCGRGDLAASWIGAGWRVLGIEPSPEAAATASRRGAEILGETLSSTPLAPDSVDAVVFRHSLEHLVEPRLDLTRVIAAVRPGGRLAVIVPNWGSWQRRAFRDSWFPLELPRHRTHFTAAGLHAAIGSAGFVRIEVRPATPLITTAWSLQFRVFDRLLTGSGAALLAGYAASLPVAAVARALDAVLGGGDFLHASAVKPG